MITTADVAEFITGSATEEDLDDVISAVNTRKRTLRDLRAMEVKPGAKVTLTDLSPKYLNGLSGVVHSTMGGRGIRRVNVTLDAESTRTLASQSTKYFIAANDEEYLLEGVPAASCQVQK